VSAIAYTVRYDAVNAMLLNEFLKEHRKNEEQEKHIDRLAAQPKEEAAQIQKSERPNWKAPNAPRKWSTTPKAGWS